MILTALLLVAAEPMAGDRSRYAACLALAKSAPGRAIESAQAWRIENGGMAALHCLALAQFERKDYAAAFSSFDAAVKASAVELQTRILVPLREQLAAIDKDAAAAPLDAYLAAEKLAVAAKGTPVAAKATAVVDRLRGRPEVLAELKARPMLAPVVKLHAYLVSQDGGFEPTSPRFQSRNSATLTQLQRLVADLKAKHPKSRALVEANRLAAELGITD